MELRIGTDIMPSAMDYANLLDYAHATTGINYAGLRKAMGVATYKEWAKFLNLAPKKWIAQYNVRGEWRTIRTSKHYEKAREAMHRFWQSCKLYETRMVWE